MSLSSADIKREIISSAKDSSIRQRMKQNLPGISEGQQVEIGNDLEALSRTRGWILVESYMLRRMNLVGLAISDKVEADQKGIAKGFIELMQWIQLSIQARDEIIEKEKQKYVAENVSKNDGSDTRSNPV